MPNILNYFTESRGDRIRRERALADDIKREQARATSAINIGRSNRQFDYDLERRKIQDDDSMLRDALYRKASSGGIDPLTAEMKAQDQMLDIKTADPLSRVSSALVEMNKNKGILPRAEDIGRSFGESSVARNDSIRDESELASDIANAERLVKPEAAYQESLSRGQRAIIEGRKADAESENLEEAVRAKQLADIAANDTRGLEAMTSRPGIQADAALNKISSAIKLKQAQDAMANYTPERAKQQQELQDISLLLELLRKQEYIKNPQSDPSYQTRRVGEIPLVNSRTNNIPSSAIPSANIPNALPGNTPVPSGTMRRKLGEPTR